MEHGDGTFEDEHVDFGEVRERFYRGEISPDEMPGIALQALAAGFEGPALLELARLDEPVIQDVGDLFERALGEMGRQSPLSKEAGLLIARVIARRIVSGDVHPYDGAYRIWTQAWHRCGRPAELTPFVGLASLYEADPERRPQHLREIVARAEELAKNQRED